MMHTSPSTDSQKGGAQLFHNDILVLNIPRRQHLSRLFRRLRNHQLHILRRKGLTRNLPMISPYLSIRRNHILAINSGLTRLINSTTHTREKGRGGETNLNCAWSLGNLSPSVIFISQKASAERTQTVSYSNKQTIAKTSDWRVRYS